MALVSLGTVWSRRGFMDMPNWIAHVLRDALWQLPSVPPDEPVPSLEALFTERVRDWEKRGASVDWDRLTDLTCLAPLACHRHLTLDHIEVDLRIKADPAIGILEREWRWTHYPFAFTVFWALIFHTPTCYLEEPGLMWEELMQLVATIYNDHGLGEQGWRGLLLALYERTLGLEVDERELRPHYVKNILKREGLSAEAQELRSECFAETVASFKRAILTRLR